MSENQIRKMSGNTSSMAPKCEECERRPSCPDKTGFALNCGEFQRTSDSKGKRTHELKCTPEYFQQTWDSNKLFEIRKNDRDFQVGDHIILREWNGGYTGRVIKDEITSVVSFPDGLKDGYVVIGIDYEMLTSWQRLRQLPG